MGDKMDRGYFVLIFVILMVSNVLALGITPGLTTFNYEPGAVKEVSFSVINSEHKDMDLVVLVKGDLNESISLSEVSFKMASSDETKNLKYTLKIPNSFSPGPHTSEIDVIQLPGKSPTSEAYIGAAVGVATQIGIFVPYPGKYAEASFNVIGPEGDGKMTFVVPLVSRGQLNIVRARGIIDIYGSLNEKIKTLETNEVEIPSGQRKEIVGIWDSKGVSPGPYRAVATVLYDDSTLTIEKQFNVGERVLELSGIEVNDFTLGGIAKFEMLVENKWSEPITGAYSQIQVFNKGGDVMADFKSSSYDVSPLSKTLMTAFWDTAGVNKGTYDSSLFLRYGQKSEQKDLKLEVLDNNINIIGVGYVISKGKTTGSGSSLVAILIIAVVVLVLINIVWFLVLRKKFSGKK